MHTASGFSKSHLNATTCLKKSVIYAWKIFQSIPFYKPASAVKFRLLLCPTEILFALERDFSKSNPNHMEVAVSFICLSHHVKYHQLVQYLAGKSKQDMGNVSSQKQTLDSTACFLQWRTSVCKPPSYQEKMQDFLLVLRVASKLGLLPSHTHR